MQVSSRVVVGVDYVCCENRVQGRFSIQLLNSNSDAVLSYLGMLLHDRYHGLFDLKATFGRHVGR